MPKGEVAGMAVRTGAFCVVVLLAALLTAVIASSASAMTPSFSANGSAEQVYVTGLPANAQASLLTSSGSTLYTQNADSLGGLLFRNVPPGKGYKVESGGAVSNPITVHSDASAPWDPSIYSQSIPDNGYTYLTTRDGTQLAIDVHPPSSPAGEPGVPSFIHLPTFPRPGVPQPTYTPPYPTLIEYSGYGYADPSGPVNGIAVLANLMGFAVVDVNMRGTGCSGGAFDFFEPLQNLDGYDVIETIAHQPWVLGNKVGMLGISYGGISQLFTAQTRPPDLEAIAPLSVIDATASTLYPGGILNTGFAVPWAEQRQQEAQPAGQGLSGTQPYAEQQIANGDQTCKQNQVLHGEATNLMAKIDANNYYHPSVADPLDPVTFVHKIDVPTFLACQWEDEQTGGHCADLAQHFTGTSQKWFTFTNGAHIDSLDPYTYDRLYDFLQLFVAHQAPISNLAPTEAAAPVIYQSAMGLPQNDIVTLPPDPIQAEPTYQSALAAFEALPEVRVLFDNGAGTEPGASSNPGDPYPAFEQSFSAFPIPGTTAQTWYFGPGGTLNAKPPAAGGADSYTSNASALPANDFTGNTGSGGLWGNASQWTWNWEPNPSGTAVSYTSAPLSSNTTVIGGGSVKAWIESSTPDVDLQATVSEVRPDGQETFVQDGWLRASERKLATSSNNIFKEPSTKLEPIPTFLASDAQPMPSGQFAAVTIPLYFEGHVYRAGSRIKVTIAAPNGTQPIWSFANTEPPNSTATEDVAFSKAMPSSLTLPVVPGVSVASGLPQCPSLRNEPCRPNPSTPNSGGTGPTGGSGSGGSGGGGPSAVSLAPTVQQSCQAGAVTGSSGSVTGVVNPSGQATSYLFQYGASAAYGQSTPAGQLPADSQDHVVQAPISGLNPGVVYHCRLVAINPSGASYGADSSFKIFGGPGGSGGPGSFQQRYGPRLRLRSVRYRPASGCQVKHAPRANISQLIDASCTRAWVTMAGTISRAADGQKLTSVAHSRVRTLRYHAAVRGGRWLIRMLLPANDVDPGVRWRVRINFGGNSTLLAATIATGFRLETQLANFSPF